MNPKIVQYLKDNLKIRISPSIDNIFNIDGSENKRTEIMVSLILDDEEISTDSCRF